MSHHSSDFDEEIISEKLKEARKTLGPTGKFPDGKLTKHDEGEIRLMVTKKDGKVILDFNSPVHWMGMTPEQAVHLGRLLIKKAKSCTS